MSPQNKKGTRTSPRSTAKTSRGPVTVPNEAAQAPVAVPNEILARIFSFAVDDLPSESSMQTAMYIGKTCKRWRTLLYSTPSLWSRLSLEFVDIDDGTMDGVQKTTSVRGLRKCLALSHPMPLYIKFCVRYSTSDMIIYSRLAHCDPDIQIAMYMLLAQSSRWKQVSFVGTTYTIGLLHSLRHLKSQVLESLTIRALGNTPPTYSTYFDSGPIDLASRLKCLDINFYIPNLRPNWSCLKSLSMGFKDVDSCRQVLAKSSNLETLTITHIGSETKEGPGIGGLIMPNVRELNLSACAACHLFDGLKVPSLVNLGLIQPSDEQLHNAHQSREIRQECPEYPSPSDADKRIVGILENSGVQVKNFNAAWYSVPSSISSTLPLVQDASVVSLRLDSEVEMIFLDKLVHAKPPLFPAVQELHLFSDMITGPEAFLASLGMIEEIVRTRRAAGLRKFTLSRDTEWEDELEQDLPAFIYASSSLAQTLCQMNKAQDFEAQWTLGPMNEDILAYAAAFKAPLV